MEKIEADTIKQLKKALNYEGFMDLIVAARIIDSDQLFQEGVQRMISSGRSPTLVQAQHIGLEATHTIMSELAKVRGRFYLKRTFKLLNLIGRRLRPHWPT